MPTARTATRSTRAASTLRTEVLTQLKEDHKRVKKAYRDFQKLDASDDSEACAAIVDQVLQELTVHAALEEELLYPAARGAISEESLIDEAEVEHESVHTLIDQLRAMTPQDDKYAARFTVLCEYVLHHVKEEEGELFPQIEKAKLDWASLGAEMTERRAELTQEASSEEAEVAGEMPSAGRSRSSAGKAGDSEAPDSDDSLD